jgi:hypothetical protein
VAWLPALSLLACGGSNLFPCTEDSQCGADGACAETGYCAFEDVTCSSGLRYGDLAPAELAGRCVDAGDTESAAGSSSGPAATTSSATAVPSATGVAPTADATPSQGTTGSAPCPPDWWDCQWVARRRIDTAWMGPELNGFPVYVPLTGDRIDPELLAPGAVDVRFVLDGVVLPHERGGSEDLPEFWTRLPTFPYAGDLYLYYGNADAPDASAPSEVWTESYFAVLHFTDETDSAGSLNLAVNDVENEPGLLGDAMGFNGATSYLQDSAPMAFDPFIEGATITALFRLNGWGQGGFGRIVDASDVNTAETGYSMSVAMNGDGGFESVRFGRGFTTRGTWYSEDSSVGLGEWLSAGVTYQNDLANEPLFFIDGQSVPVVASRFPTGVVVPPPLPLTIGALANTSLRFFDGAIDEIHIAQERRSSEWLEAENLSMRDELLTFGPEERL